MGAACDTFYRIYDSDADRSNVVTSILEQLEFHPLSITLLATVTYQNKWDTNRLTREWERQRTSMLQTQHNTSLAATIELSLASPLFQELGPDARALLGVIAFFPQGVDENNLEWLFPTISNRADILDKLCILSLAYRSNGFVTMLAPLRDYLSPKDPKESSLLCATKKHYFTRMLVVIDPDKPSFRESQWIMSEDVNVEHLLDVFTTIDTNSVGIWGACAAFMGHLVWHKQRLTVLGPKIEGLPDDHLLKLECLTLLSQFFGAVGNQVECKRLLVYILGVWRERESDRQVATTLMGLAEVNWLIGLHKEGIQWAKEALGAYEKLGDTQGQAVCLMKLALLLCGDKQLDAAEEAAFRALDLLPEEGGQSLVCKSHRTLGGVYRSKGEIGKAVHHLEVALGIATLFNWHEDLFAVHYELVGLFRDEGRFDDAQAHVEHTKSHAVNHPYYLGLATELQARIWYRQHRLEEAKSEALRAVDIFEKLGAAKDVERCRKLFQDIGKGLNIAVAPGRSNLNRELL